MSTMASNYDVPKLVAGIVMAFTAIAVAAYANQVASTETFTSFMPFTIVAIAYGIMMFASSYVEEEQHFWYWTTTAWLGYTMIRDFNGFVQFFNLCSSQPSPD